VAKWLVRPAAPGSNPARHPSLVSALENLGAGKQRYRFSSAAEGVFQRSSSRVSPSSRMNIVSVRLSPEKLGPLGKPPALPRSSTLSRTSARTRAVTLLLYEPQRQDTQYECGRMQPLLC
jgi:hypothetical protein